MCTQVPSLKFRLAVLTAVLVFLAGLSSPVYSATIYVRTTGSDANTGEDWDNALQTVSAALSKAKQGDTVQVAGGPYNEHVIMKRGIKLLGGFPEPPTGGTTDTVLDGTGLTVAVVDIVNIEDATFDGFTVQNGQYGGINVVECKRVTVSNNLVLKNYAAAGAGGGGYFNHFEEGLISNNIFRENIAINGGGAFFINCETDIRGNTFVNNGATRNGGGAVIEQQKDESSVKWNTFKANVAKQGAGVHGVGKARTFESNWLFSNKAENSGGGISWLELSGVLRNLMVYRNHAKGSGGGVYLADPQNTPLLESVTVADNTADAFGYGLVTDGSVKIKNSIFWNKDQFGTSHDFFVSGQGSYLDISFSDTANPLLAGSNGNISADPLFDSTYHLQAGSPAIGQAEPLAADGSNAYKVDIDGHWRFPPGDNLSDMGADEFNAICLDVDGDGICAPESHGNDCDDFDNTTYPGASEICDGMDNDCDNIIDNEDLLTYKYYYLDSDGDGYGNLNEADYSCSQKTGYVDDFTDCDDTDPTIHPGAVEACDGIDQNCNGTDSDCDSDSDGSPGDVDCDDNDPNTYPGAPELCDGKDNDCQNGIPINEGDTDGDGAIDCNDGCPDDPAKTTPGECGCGVADDLDSDGDGVPDCNDQCPDDPAKTDPGECGCGIADAGICGCGIPDTDTDNDGTPDCNDGCPDDPNKTDPGECGCGTPDTDTDNDGILDCNDGCPDDPNKTAPGECGCGTPDTDTDNDGILDCNDGCPDDPNKTDPGECGCGSPDTDSDGDGSLVCNDCNDNDPLRFPESPEVCDGIDNNCDGVIPLTEVDNDGDGLTECAGDCDDTNKLSYPGAPELCGDNSDNDCDGETDENNCEHHDVQLRKIKAKRKINRCEKKQAIKIYIKNKTHSVETIKVILEKNGTPLKEWYPVILSKKRNLKLKYYYKYDPAIDNGIVEWSAYVVIPYDENPLDNISRILKIKVSCEDDEQGGGQGGSPGGGESHDVKLENIDVIRKMKKCDQEYKVTVQVRNKTNTAETAEVTLYKESKGIKIPVKAWSPVNLGPKENLSMDYMYKPSEFGDNRTKIKWTANIVIPVDNYPSDNLYGPRKSKVKCK